ncbi:MAG TPA: pilus assembly protein [Janthinobacterium sp.]|nr:pilus assembly protein [Janthinobacterium sp.]
MNTNHRLSSRLNGMRGFTLIDVMTAVAIVGILAAIAIPSYISFLAKGNRSAAQAHLADIAQQQQQYLLDARTYASTLVQLHMTTPGNVSAYYTVAITNGDAPPTFTATATPIAGTGQAADVTLSIDSAGNKLPSGTW